MGEETDYVNSESKQMNSELGFLLFEAYFLTICSNKLEINKSSLLYIRFFHFQNFIYKRHIFRYWKQNTMAQIGTEPTIFIAQLKPTGTLF